MTKSGPLACSSHHHQGIDRVGSELAVTGRSPDGLVEAIERIGARSAGRERHLDGRCPVASGGDGDGGPRSAVALRLPRLARAIARFPCQTGENSGPQPRVRPGATPIPGGPPGSSQKPRGSAEPSASLSIRIDHVGSTSVPGLDAKPIVDIQLSLASMIPRHAYVEPLTRLGYRWVVDPWTDEHEYFSRNQDGDRAFQIHVCRSGSEWERRHLAFRDWLREHPSDADEYARLKRALADQHPRDILAVHRRQDSVHQADRGPGARGGRRRMTLRPGCLARSAGHGDNRDRAGRHRGRPGEDLQLG